MRFFTVFCFGVAPCCTINRFVVGRIRKTHIWHRAMTKRRGEFEACFASGLDLSELTIPSASTNTAPTEMSENQNHATSSHSANLLRIKQTDLAAKREREHEEIRIQNLISIRSEQLKLATSNSKATVPKLPAPSHQPIPQETQIAQSNGTIEAKTSSGHSSSRMTHTVLVGMHDESHRKGYDNMPRKMLMKRNQNSNGKSSKKVIAKKTMKRKF